MAKAKRKPETDESPKVKGKPLEAPKKAAKKTVKKTVQKAEMKTRETVKEQAKPTSDTDESPERYAENRGAMYFDITPGTPPIFRRDALRWMYMCGFNMKHRVLWGTDCRSNFDPEYAKFWASLDKKIMAEISADPNIYRVPGQDLYDYSDIWELATEKNFDDFFGKK